jgi:alpha-tubulin suppressor-like RCC1 family protein
LTIGTDTTEVLAFPVSFSAVSAATSYVLEWSKAQDFSGAKADTLTVRVDTIAVADTGQYYVRVRAVNADVTTNGRASSPQTVFVTQGVATVTVTPATANVAAGATQQFSAAAKDGNGTAVANVTFYWASSDPSIATVTQTGLATGVAGAGGAVTITAVGKGQPGSATLTVGAQAATKLAFSVQPVSAVAGAAVSPAIQVEVRDANGNRVATARDPVTIAFGTNAGSGTLYGTQVVNAINGIASFSGLWVDKAAAGYTLAASSGSLTGATSTTFDVAPAAPAKLGFSVQPTNVLGNVSINPSVQVNITDLYDNQTTASSQVDVSLGANPWATPFSTGGKLAGTLTLAATNGVAVFTDLSVDKPGPGYRLQASSGALSTARSDTFRVSLLAQQSSVGSYHVCVVMSTGTYCWGRNSEGQLGSGGFSTADSVAALVRGGLTFVQAAAGYVHSCGITAAGAAYCWGYNAYGQVGDGTSGTNRNQPVAVTGGHVFASIAAGFYHTCGITTASGTAAEDRQVYCWGNNGNGQLGDGTTTNNATPVRVANPLQTTTRATVLSLGSGHSCARALDNQIYCWGYNGDGELGNNTAVSSAVPVGVALARTWTTVAAGASHSCGLDVNNDAYCWGYNGYGQLGDGTTTGRLLPTLVTGGLKLSSIGAGSYHTCAVLGVNGNGYCWGRNFEGQLGDNQGSGNQSTAPVQVNGTLSFTRITGGYYNTCGRSGTGVYCWGQNNYGQLGNGTRGANVLIPAQIVQ